ncbi:MAG: hypothetical protein CSA45_06805 [Gammaproteobacteria bacterium]|nr:MAG: hypothetical protein CSA45_06805 [Gammaproteobacteria bacterium]
MSDNPYQAPKAPLNLPPDPPTPTLIRGAYLLIVINLLLAQLYTVWLLLEDTNFANNILIFMVLTVLNLVIAWLLYQPIRDRKTNAWIIPSILLFLTIANVLYDLSIGSSDLVSLWVSGGETLTLIGLLGIIFSPAGKAWRHSSDNYSNMH